MDETAQLQCLVMLLGGIYTLAMCYSIRLQYKTFNECRYLEMSYYLTSFFFACTSYSARAIFCCFYAFSSNTHISSILRFVPDAFIFPIASMLAYLW